MSKLLDKKRETQSCAESQWLYEEFANEDEKLRKFASFTEKVANRAGYVTKILIWVKDESGARKN